VSRRTTSHRIRSIAVMGGFLDGARFDLADGLNCFIGARGTGKTTALELVRYALDALPAREHQPGERRRIELLVERNLAGGRIEVTVETKDGLCYIVNRSAGEEPIVLTADRQPTDITLRAGGIFRADIYSQNEVESIADRTASQLALLDNFEAQRIAEIESRLDHIRASLSANANQIVPLQTRLAALTEELGTLPSIEEQLKKYTADGGDNSDAINQAHHRKAIRDRQRRIIAGSKEMLKALADHLATAKGRIAQQAAGLQDEEVLEGPNAAIMEKVFERLLLCGEKVDSLLQSTEECIAAALDELTAVGSQLAANHKQQELEFRELIEQHQQAQGQAAERAQLEQRRNELLTKNRQRRQLTEELSALESTRKALLEQLSEQLDERFAVRQNVAQRINVQLMPAIRVNILQYGNPEQYQRLLEEGLKGARLKHGLVAQRLANAFWPGDLVAALRRHDAAVLIERAGLNPDQADKVVACLSNSSLLFELEMVELSDLPRIELKDGESYKDSTSLSTGQKCTTILPILLLDSDNPLLVDQPEDNLDNRFIFEAVVDSIRKVKTRRQMIFVTHNPNIPVFGDAARVFVLDSAGVTAHKANDGTVDCCKKDIVTLLEGGEDAFKARKCRYAY